MTKETPPPVDKLGHPITVGCYIIYGSLLGRSAGLNVGKVLAMTYHIPTYGGRPSWRFSVVHHEEPTSWNDYNTVSKRGMLLYSDRIVVIDATMLGSVYAALKAIDISQTSV